MDHINKLLSFIPDDKLQHIAFDTSVDKYAKKLQGELLFKLLFYCLLTEKETSLRGMRSALECALFQAMGNKFNTPTISHSSISERLNSIKVEYFEKIYQHCIEAYKSNFKKEAKDVVRFDSTIVSLSTKLLKIGYQVKGSKAESYRMLKFTVGFSDIPECICFYTSQSHTSENIALRQAIIETQLPKASKTVVFDRGISSRDSYDLLTKNNIQFVSRINDNPKQTIHTANKIKKKIQTDTLTIISDSWVYLYTERKTRSEYPVRLIKAIKKSDKESIVFISNMDSLTPFEITEVYKSRWGIEVFFKFIKQHLNFSHLLNRTENGIKVIMYVTMTAAILLLEYKQLKKLKGYKLTKQKFAYDLERNIIYNIVIICNGDEMKAKKMLYPDSS